MSWRTCHGCEGKGYVILKDKDGSEIMNKCIICDGAGVILVEEMHPYAPWPPQTPWTLWKWSDGTPVYPDIQYGSANDVLSWIPCDLYGAEIYVQMC